MKYEAPRVQTFGSFRDLTLVGAVGAGDLGSVQGPPTGCFPTTDPGDCRVS